MSVSIRPKVDADRAAVVALMERTREHNMYPLVWPADPDAFANSAQERAAWVAMSGGQIVGHVALHDASVDPLRPVVESATGLGAEAIVVVARLLVDPGEQGSGIGARLLDVATEGAHASGRRPALDVNQASEDAIGFYEQARGWERLGGFDIELPDATIPVWAYLGPPAPRND